LKRKFASGGKWKRRWGGGEKEKILRNRKVKGKNPFRERATKNTSRTMGKKKRTGKEGKRAWPAQRLPLRKRKGAGIGSVVEKKV